MAGEVKEECAVAAITLLNGEGLKTEGGAAFYLSQMLLQMQNRGQLASGITTYSPKRTRVLSTHKKVGTVSETFAINSKERFSSIMKQFNGHSGIGHNRYSTSGTDDEYSAQPFEHSGSKPWEWFAFSFNGNIANFTELKASSGPLPSSRPDLDTEVVMHFLAKAQAPVKADIQDVFKGLTEKFDGAYNIAYVDAEGTVAAMRDPLGIRPMCYSITDGFAGAASESVAFYGMTDEDPKTLKPGEMLVSKDGTAEVKRYAKSPRNAHCMFEYVYFSNAASVLDGRSVYDVRWKLGVELAKQETISLNPNEFVVVPIPDTAKPAADGYAYTSGLPAMEGLIKNRGYTGRTFIEGANREEKVKQKFNVNKAAIKGKKVILIDDSIVRGTTSKFLVNHLKENGKAKEVHVRVTCPPVRSPCFYGIDMSKMGELIANRHSNSEQLQRNGWNNLDEEVVNGIAKEIGADSLRYMSLDGLVKCIGLENGKKDMCMACLTGDYPTPWGERLRRKALDSYIHGTEGKRTYE